MQPVVECRIGEERTQFVEDEGFRERSQLLGGRWIGQSAGQRPGDAAVEEIELALSNLSGGRFQFPWGQPEPDQRIRQDLEMALYGPAADPGVARDTGDAGGLSVLARGDLQKTRESADVAGQCLGLNFLGEIGFGIRPEIVSRIVRGDRHRQCSKAQNSLRPEFERQLRRHQRKHGCRDGPAGQQVGAAAPQFAGAGPGEHESQAMGLDETVHFVQYSGDLLHLVDHHPLAGGQSGKLSIQTVRVLAQPQCLRGVEQIIGNGAGKTVADPGGLAGPSGSEQKDRSNRCGQ